MVDPEIRPAVVLTDVVKSYDSNLALDGLTMTVEEGSIYGLLGPSGCGKTTALSCIVGICGMDSGQVQLNIKKKTQLGFMPQNCGLFGELTSEETFYFHGRINLMSEDAIESRIKELVQLLELPKITALIKNISGGQQRRVSLAVALLHDPSLLLLDEPTVGLDPILRYTIWEHLTQLVVNRRKTILLTTHYIEEARFANTVGFMLDGVLLEEDSPDRILQNHGLNSLEDVFLHLSSQKYKYSIETNSTVVKERRTNITVCSPLTEVGLTPLSMKRLSAQIIKNFTWFKRSLLLVVYLGFIAPMMCSVLLYESIGKNPFDLKIGTVRSGGYTSCEDQLTVGCNTLLGCRLVENLRSKTYKVIEFSSEQSGINAVQHNAVWAVISFPVNLTSSFLELSSRGIYVEDSLVESGLFNITMDMSNSIIGSQIRKDIHDGYYEVLTDWFADCGWSARSSLPPIKFTDPVFGTNDVQFTTFVFPGLMCMFPFVFACLFSMATILVEKMTGVIERSMVTGLLWSEFLIAHILVALIILVFNAGAPYIVIFGYYNIPHHGHFFASYIITYLQGLSGICCGILIAVVCNSETLATQTYITIVFLCTYGTGGMWPVEGMHWIARVISLCLPITVPLESIRHVIDRGWSIMYYPVLKGVIFSVIWSSFFLLIASFILYRKTKLLK